MSHDIHEGSYRVFADNCVECATRVRRGLAAVLTVDQENRDRLGTLALELRHGGGEIPADTSSSDRTIAWLLIEAALTLHEVGLTVDEIVTPPAFLTPCTCESTGHCQVCQPQRDAGRYLG